MSRIYLAILLCFLAGVAVISGGPIVEKDTFWHVASGRFMLAQHRLPEPDPFTFTAGDRRDVHHEWLAQIGLALIDRWTGLRGLRYARVLLASATLALGFLIFRRRGFHPAGAMAGLAVWWVLLQPNVTIRPHVFGWILAVAVIGWFLPQRNAWGARRSLGFLALMILWVNLHSSAMIVPAILLLFLVGVLAEGAWHRAVDMATLRAYAPPTLLSLLGCLIQPAGLRLVPYVFATPGVNAGLSVEWLPLFASDVEKYYPMLLVAYLVLAAWTVIAVLRSPRQTWREFPGPLASLVMLVLAVQTRRMTFFLFVPLLYALRATRPWSSGSARMRKLARPPFVLAGVILLAGTALWATRRPDGPWFSSGDLLPRRFPEQACEFLSQSRLQGHMFNPFDWGGYLSYRLYPDYRTFGDGRWILVGRELVLDMQAVLERSGDVEGTLDRYGIDFLVEPMGKYAHSLPLDPGRWLLAYADDATVVLLRRTPLLEENVSRVRTYYRRFPEYVPRARWPFVLHSQPGAVTPTSVPSVLDADGDAGIRSFRLGSPKSAGG